MASKASIALLLVVNLLFFALVSANCPPSSDSDDDQTSSSSSSSSQGQDTSSSSQGTGSSQGSSSSSQGTDSSQITSSSPENSPSQETCDINLAVCLNVLDGLVNVTLGKPPKEPCCPLINGLLDLEAAVCLCTELKASVLNLINLDLDIQLSLLLNYCGKQVPADFSCS